MTAYPPGPRAGRTPIPLHPRIHIGRPDPTANGCAWAPLGSTHVGALASSGFGSAVGCGPHKVRNLAWKGAKFCQETRCGWTLFSG